MENELMIVNNNELELTKEGIKFINKIPSPTHVARAAKLFDSAVLPAASEVTGRVGRFLGGIEVACVCGNFAPRARAGVTRPPLSAGEPQPE